MILSRKHNNFSNTGGKVAASIILVCSLAVILSLTLAGLIVGIVLSVGALFMLTAYEGIEVNLQHKIYRDLSSYFWLKTGEWKSLPELTKVSVVESTEQIKVADGYNNSIHSSRRNYLVRLHPVNSKRTIIVSRVRKLEEAKSDAALLSKAFGLEVKLPEYVN